MVGPNNCGKSTIISSFRILDVGLKIAFAKSAIRIPSFNGGYTFGHQISENHIPVAVENVHTDYENIDSRIEFRVSNGNKFFLYFPVEGGCFISWKTEGKNIRTPGLLRKAFPISIQVVPVLGPLEHEESVRAEETIKRSLNTHRASSHFRNYWHYFPDGFDEFSKLVEKTWPGMELEPPEIPNILDQKLIMLCRENRITREIFWAGFGFQVWCQLLTHISRASNASILIVDEPEIYLHPDVQRQLLGILRDISADILLATHSTEIMSEADPGEILLVDKAKKSAKRLKNVEGIQEALESVGSVQNITLTQLARTKKILFLEGLKDFKIIRRFAKKMGYQELSSGVDLTPFESGGFSSWEKVKALAWGLSKTIGSSFYIGTIYDRDYWCEEELAEIKAELDKNLNFSHIHQKKEIENYLLIIPVLERALIKAIKERENRTNVTIEVTVSTSTILDNITSKKKESTQSQYLAKRSEFLRERKADVATINAETLRNFNKIWENLDQRLSIVPGKETLRELRSEVDNIYGVNLTDIKIIDEFEKDEVPEDLVELIENLERIRVQ
ncbi:ATP-dependent endonuclease [uncultured Desulfobacter sp.]|uniref:ATP-dependent nuclease n=1 Tax=uncultured Desulfobacter sp. TaxID=240139 RepID=UPI00374936DD